MSTPARHPAIIDDPVTDDRWQLVQRIVSSPPFHKSGRLRDLLLYITEQTIRGFANELTEQHIGEAVFHKAAGYSPLEDSSVRVHARQLRLKLHEYFDGVGREEALVVEIPKGAYTPIFRPAKAQLPSALPAQIEPVTTLFRRATVPWILCGALAILFAATVLFNRFDRPASVAAASPVWPFSQIFDTRHQTVIAVADGNYGMWRILTGERGSLEQYLNRDLPQKSATLKFGEAGSRFADYISNSTLTSFAERRGCGFAGEGSGALPEPRFRAFREGPQNTRFGSRELCFHRKPSLQPVGLAIPGQTELSRERGGSRQKRKGVCEYEAAPRRAGAVSGFAVDWN